MKVELRPFANGASSGAFDCESCTCIALLATARSRVARAVPDRIPLQSLTRLESRGYRISVLSDPHPDRLSVSETCNHSHGARDTPARYRVAGNLWLPVAVWLQLLMRIVGCGTWL